MNNSPIFTVDDKFAEREGFEPPVPLRTSDFESDTIDHSDTSPLPEIKFDD